MARGVAVWLLWMSSEGDHWSQVQGRGRLQEWGRERKGMLPFLTGTWHHPGALSLSFSPFLAPGRVGRRWLIYHRQVSLEDLGSSLKVALMPSCLPWLGWHSGCQRWSRTLVVSEVREAGDGWSRRYLSAPSGILSPWARLVLCGAFTNRILSNSDTDLLAR